ncbi:MAG: hypothetical protein ACREIS_08195 [Nitrospiraceae bacterium]
MKTIAAKYATTCIGCGTTIKPGQTITGSRGGWYHGSGGGQGCAPSADRVADREYHQGIQDVENWRENRRLFGDEAAEAMEIEREMREDW